MFQKSIILLLLTASSLLLNSCGSSDLGGGSAFNTVNAWVTVDPASNPLKADIAKWTGTACAADSTLSVVDDLVNFTVTTTASIANGTISPLRIQNVTLTFTPLNATMPVLPAQFVTQRLPLGGVIVQPGSVSVPVQVASHNFKDFFSPAICEAVPVYEYYVTASFEAVEVNTGKTGTLTSVMTIQVADFAD